MTNRKISYPILRALVLTFAVFSTAQAQTQGFSAGVATPSAPATATATPATAPASHTSTYTVVKGDSLTSISKKFNTTRKKLRALNNLADTIVAVKPGDILLVPARPVAKTSPAKTHHAAYLAAQPVQDFDVPASTFASCPVPLPTPGDDVPAPAAPTPDVAEQPAPIAKLVSPAEMATETPPDVEIITPRSPTPVPMPAPEVTQAEAPAPAPVVAAPKISSKSNSVSSRPASIAATTPAPDGRAFPTPYNPPAPHLTSRGTNLATTPSLRSNPAALQTASANDWGSRFFQQARALGNEGIEYDGDWRPPGESHSWVMDCSNTSRYLYKVTTGIQLPRTASDQYYYLHLQGKAWDVPLNSYGFVDTTYLRDHLKPGDLLFWENTYRPERQPPITHVMVYLGTNDKGQWIMAGSQSSRGGEHNRRSGGPDIYVFRPSQPCGGYTTWMGLVHHQGRFCAFGRPLEADPTKLSVAEDN